LQIHVDLDENISRGSYRSTCFKHGGVLNDEFITNLLLEFDSEITMTTDKHLAKLTDKCIAYNCFMPRPYGALSSVAIPPSVCLSLPCP